MNSLEDGTEEMQFTWRIKDFDMFPRLYEGAIRSPMISMGNPRHTVWYLELYPRVTMADERTITYTFVYLNGSADGCGTSPVQVLLVDINGETREVTSSDSLTIENRFLPLGTLTLRCRFWCRNISPQYVTDLTELSQHFCSLYESKEFSDITLHTSDKEFLVHNFVLRTRAPKLFEMLGLSCESIKHQSMEVDQISTPVLQILLQYLYSGNLGNVPEENLSEYYEVADKYELVELNSEITPLTSPATICTQVNVIKRNICWNINVNDALRDKNPFLKSIHIEYARFIIKVSFTSDLSIWIHTSIRCVSIEDNILMSCITYIGEGGNNLEHHREKRLLFSPLHRGKELRLPKRSYRKNIAEENLNLILKFKLKMSKGEHASSVDFTSSLELPSVFGLGLLRCDMAQLLSDTITNRTGDVILRFTNAEVSAHKAVLAAWSPVFSSMFHHDMAEKNSGEVDITDVDKETGLGLLYFIYARHTLDSFTFANYVNLFVAADKYQVTPLFKMCSEFLESSVTKDNACQILVLADDHNDEGLLEEVQRYIVFERDEILISNDWLSLVDTHPRLVSKVLRAISEVLRA